MPKDVILTPEGLEKLQSELDFLSNEKRREVAERIKEAREFGDIAENAEYDDAKNEQAMLEARIATVAEKLRMATVIDAEGLSTDVVAVGSVGPRQGREDRQVARATRSSAPPRRSPRRTSSRTSRRSGAPCSGTGATTSSRCRSRADPPRKLKITKIDVGLK